jgi:hypothetical protein
LSAVATKAKDLVRCAMDDAACALPSLTSEFAFESPNSVLRGEVKSWER